MTDDAEALDLLALELLKGQLDSQDHMKIVEAAREILAAAGLLPQDPFNADPCEGLVEKNFKPQLN